jgi:GNAT superfamily N-acetyltransferase
LASVTTEYPLVDRALSQRLERAEGMANRRMIEARARLAPQTGAAWLESAGAYAMFDGAESPLTQTFCLGMFAVPTPESLDAIEGFYRARGVAVNQEVSPIADPSVFPLLVARGYHPIEFTSVMFRPIDIEIAAPADNPDIEVTRVIGDDDGRWAKTAAAGWSEFVGLGDFLLDIGRVQAAADDAHRFMAILEGEPIAAGGLSLHGGVALLAGASTIPSARRRGAQQALLAARLRFAAAHGCDLAMMCALPGSGSQRNAERRGFRIAYTRTKWLLK